MRKLVLSILVAVASTLAPNVAGAAPCSGFIDVDDSSPFCTNVQWIRNRNVTLGCSTPGSYCPSDPVIRLSMALFLHRLGIALTPDIMQGAETVNGAIDTPLIRCVNTVIVSGWPRRAYAVGTFATLQNAGAADIAVQFVESTNFGATWTPASPLQTMSVADQGGGSVMVIMGPRELAVGTSYQYAIRVARAAGSSTTGTPANGSCRYLLTVGNRNPTSPPFDE